MRTLVRVLGWLLAAAVVGLGIGLFKGDGGHVLRNEAGNLSAPWLLVALVPGWFAGSWWRGALLGLACTLVGLAGFYAGVAAVLYDHLGSNASYLWAWHFLVSANRIWLQAGALSGPVCGLLAGALGARLRPAWLGVVAGLVLLGEYPVLRMIGDVRLPGLRIRDGWSGGTTVALAEAYVGIAVLALTGLLVVGSRTRRAWPGV